MTRSVKFTVVSFLLVGAFALGMLFSQQSRPQPIAAQGATNTFPGSGFTGIGTTSPNTNLHVFSSAGGAATEVTVASGPLGNKAFFNLLSETSSAQFRFRADNNAPSNEWSLGQKTGSTDLQIVGAQDLVDETALMVIQQSGNVGIGTTNPAHRLDVNGSSMRVASNSGSSTVLTVQSTAPSGKAFLNLFSQSNSAQIRFKADNNASSNNWTIGQKSGSADLQLVPAGDLNDTPAAMVIQQDGDIGVGTTSPAEKLHVQGNIKLSGNITSDGEICIGSGC